MDISIIDMRELSDVTEMDKMELLIGNAPQTPCPLDHFFTPGIYTRKIFMPAGTFVVSVKHKTTHPFFILSGKVAVLKEKTGGDLDGGFEVEGLFEAGYMGITIPDTKRFLYNIEDTVWVTCHANPDNIQDPNDMVLSYSEKNDNPLHDPDDYKFNGWKKEISPSVIHNQLKLS